MTLYFVYNADDGLFNALSDTVHKVFSPETYACRLCYFTYGIFGMVSSWRNYLKSLAFEVKFYHRKEFWRVYGRKDIALPAVLIEKDGQLAILLSVEDIDGCTSLDELIKKMNHALESIDIPNNG